MSLGRVNGLPPDLKARRGDRGMGRTTGLIHPLHICDARRAKILTDMDDPTLDPIVPRVRMVVGNGGTTVGVTGENYCRKLEFTRVYTVLI